MAVNCISAGTAIPMLRYFGRRSLLLATFFICACTLIVFTFLSNTIMQLTAILIFIVMFEFGPGPVTWIYMSEIMNEKGVAVATFVNWTFTLVIGIITPYVFSKLGQNTFVIFALTCGLGFLFIFVFIKETKGLGET